MKSGLLFLRSFLLLLLVLVFTSSCEKENMFDCLKSTGSIKTVTRELTSFHTLQMEDNVDVWIVPDTKTFVEVKAGNNLLSNIKTEVKDGKLTIKNINQCNWVRDYDKPVEARLHTPVFTNLFLLGSGNLKATAPFNLDTVFLHINGAGDLDLEINSKYLWADMYDVGNMYLRGTNKLLIATVGGFGNLKSFDLINSAIYIKMIDEGSAEVQATEIIGAEFKVNGYGNVHYIGNPAQAGYSGPGKGKLINAN